MEKYYSSALLSSGLFCYYKVLPILEKKSTVYIVNNGTDFEQSVFFDELKRQFNGYDTTQYIPFYSDNTNGLYIKKYDTYIITNSAYCKTSPIAIGNCEKEISITQNRFVTKSEKLELTKHFSAEKRDFKKAISFLGYARSCKENRNSLLSDYLSDDRMINTIARLIKRIPINKSGRSSVQFLTSVTPLGIHTIWDTVFTNYENVIEIQDDMAFSSAIILGVIRDRLLSQNESFILVPELFHKTIPQMLLLPQSSTAIIRTDSNCILPFAPTRRINTEKFVLLPKKVSEKCDLLYSAENSYIKKAVECIYEASDERRKMNKILFPYCDIESIKKIAEAVASEIIK